MEKVQEVFRRYEKKYLLTCEQQKALMDKVGERLVLDEYVCIQSAIFILIRGIMSSYGRR